MITILNAKLHETSTRSYSISDDVPYQRPFSRRFSHEQKEQSWWLCRWNYFSCLPHETLLLLQGPLALSSGISHIFLRKFCITVVLLSDQSKTAFKSQINTVATKLDQKKRLNWGWNSSCLQAGFWCTTRNFNQYNCIFETT